MHRKYSRDTTSRFIAESMAMRRRRGMRRHATATPIHTQPYFPEVRSTGYVPPSMWAPCFRRCFRWRAAAAQPHYRKGLTIMDTHDIRSALDIDGLDAGAMHAHVSNG